ncbi:hypothetical protein QOZ80_1BG0053890 [Eleusine coracana subsp. coracana]|nr:hypothetical protein QOZ80_1BG0053890 [Eleusine coracana subsp. coracana]
MEGVRHRTVEVNGVRLHVAEMGPEKDGAVVLLLHGFPDLWYGWRHQMAALAARGYRAVAPDLRGYGESAVPPDAASYTTFHVVGDLVALIADLAQPQVFVVGHDWGAIVAWQLCLLRPDLVRALVNLSVAYQPRAPDGSPPIQAIKALCGEDHYMCVFQKPGVAEAEFARYDLKYVFKKTFGMRKAAPLILAKDKSFFDSLDSDGSCPAWLSEEDVSYYADRFQITGFTGGLNYYRCMDLNWELSAPWTVVPVKVPTKFIIGDLDITYNMPGVKDFINKGGFKASVPNLEDVVVMEGVGHFINQEKPKEVSDHICEFFSKF